MDSMIISKLRITTIFKFNPNYIVIPILVYKPLIDEEIPNYYLNRSGHYIKQKNLKVFYFSFIRIFVVKK